MRPLVQDYLLTHSLADLRAEHGVKSKVKGYKASLCYHQLDARHDDQLACQCRGMVIATDDGSPLSEDGVVGKTCIMAWPFNRFFNYGEPHAAYIDWSTATVTEKLDGTLCIFYFDTIVDQWMVATRNMPEADGDVEGSNMTFRLLFMAAFIAQFDQRSVLFDIEKTYMFELTSQVNQIVVPYSETKLTMLGQRDTAAGFESKPWADRAPHKYDVPSNFDGLLDMVRDWKPTEHEGIVVCDAKFNRVKIKSPSYLLAARLSDKAASTRGILELILSGRYDDVVPVLPAYRIKQGDYFKEKLRWWERWHEGVIKEGLIDASHIYDPRERRKVFAIRASTSGIWMGPAMKSYEVGHPISVIDWLATKQNPDGTYPPSVLDKLLVDLGLPHDQL